MTIPAPFACPGVTARSRCAPRGTPWPPGPGSPAPGRSSHALEQPAPDGSHDFIPYLEGADEDLAVSGEVCANGRDVARKPGWQLVREGPTGHGRRVPTWEALFAAP